MVADRFRLRYKLTHQHYQTYLKQAAKRAKSKSSWKNFLLPVLIGFPSGLLLIYLQKKAYVTDQNIIAFFAGAILMIVAIGIFSLKANARMVANIVGTHDAMTGEFTLAAYEGGGIQITGKHLQSSFDWTACMDLTQSSDILVLWIDKGAGTIIPHAAFADEEERQQFIDFANERINHYKTNA